LFAGNQCGPLDKNEGVSLEKKITATLFKNLFTLVHTFALAAEMKQIFAEFELKQQNIDIVKLY